MFGWRGRIGYVAPVALSTSQERDKVLPEGVVLVYYTLNIGILGPGEFERLFDKYLPAAKHIAEQAAQFTILSGSPVVEHQYEKSLELAKRVQEATGVPTIINTTAHINGLKKVSTKKVVIVSPLVKKIDENRARILESEGMDVVHIKNLGLKTNLEWGSLPPYASYRLAMEAIREAPEADTVNIVCPSWEVMSNIELIERDSGKTVVTSFASELFTALNALQIKGPIKGYGQLLEML
jgi:maleate cis-trans isomerase